MQRFGGKIKIPKNSIRCHDQATMASSTQNIGRWLNPEELPSRRATVWLVPIELASCFSYHYIAS